MSPVITEGNEPYVHHFAVYLCGSLNGLEIGPGMPCHDDVLFRFCAAVEILTFWGVGSEVCYTLDYADNRPNTKWQLLEVELPWSVFNLACITCVQGTLWWGQQFLPTRLVCLLMNFSKNSVLLIIIIVTSHFPRSWYFLKMLDTQWEDLVVPALL